MQEEAGLPVTALVHQKAPLKAVIVPLLFQNPVVRPLVQKVLQEAVSLGIVLAVIVPGYRQL